MSFNSNPVVLFGKMCAVLVVGQLLASAAFGQITTSAAGMPVAESHNNFYAWYAALAVLGAGFCVSLLWWRHEKNKTEFKQPSPRTANNKFANSGAPLKANSQNVHSSAVRQKPAANKPAPALKPAESAPKTTVWANSGVSHATSSANVSTALVPALENAVTTAAAADKTASLTALPFEISTPPAVTPLPSSDDANLHEAAAQALDFDATEEEREISMMILADFKTEVAVETLSQIALYDESSRLRIGALGVLADFNHESVFEPILLACADIARVVRAAAARTLSRLEFDRSEAFARIVESNDSERLRLAAMACVDAGLVTHAFARLVHQDRKQANEAFAIVRLLVAAGQTQSIINAITSHADPKVRLTTIQILKTLKPDNLLPALQEVAAKENLPADVRQALDDLIGELDKA